MPGFRTLLSVLLGLAAFLPAAEFMTDEHGVVTAEDGGRVLWSTPLLNIDAALPVTAGPWVFTAQENHLIMLNAGTGVIEAAVPFPGYIESLVTTRDGLEIECRSRTMIDDNPAFSEVFVWKPGDSPPRNYRSGRLAETLYLWRLADARVTAAAQAAGIDVSWGLEDVLDGDGRPDTLHPTLLTPAVRADLVRFLPVIEGCLRGHPSNPWYAFRMAAVLHLLGDDPAADAWMERAGPAIAASETALRMSAEAYNFGRTDWSARLFDHGMGLAHREGAILGLPTSLIQVLIELPIGPAIRQALAAGRTEEAALLLERLYTVAPRTEMVAGAYGRMAAIEAAAGRSDQSALWRARRDEARPYYLFGVGIPDWKTISLTVFGAGLPAFILLAGIIVVRHIHRLGLLQKAAAAGDAAARLSRGAQWNPFCTCRSGEILSFVSVGAVIVLSALVMGGVLETIARAASADLAALSGNPGNPAARAWYECQADCDARHILVGLHYFVRDEYPAALAEFDRAPGSPAARINKGAVLRLLGREAEARAAFGSVKEGACADAARYNLTGEPRDYWSRLAARYFPGEPLTVPPSTAEWRRLLGADRLFAASPASIVNWSRLGGTGGARGTVLMFGLLLGLVVAAVIGVFAAWRVFVRPVPLPGDDDRRGWQWWLGLAVPGAARQWSPAGGVLLVLCLTAIIIMRINTALPGALSQIEAIAVPDITRITGLEGGPGAVSALRLFFTAAPGLLVAGLFGLNLAFMLAVRCRSGRPAAGAAGGTAAAPPGV